MKFNDSQTHLNLMRAFAGESQARNRYSIAARQAERQGLRVVSAAFSFTAEQEREHAEVFYSLLSSLNDETLHVDGSYPVNASNSLEDLLRAARHNEIEEWETVYPAFADIAKQEGFTAVSDAFRRIAEIEHVHALRFGQYAELMESGKLFSDDQPVQWMCLNCGHIHTAAEAPRVCPVCKHGQGDFIRSDLSPMRVTL